MTIKELIEKLQQLDPELRVFTKGYEGGYEDAKIRDEIHNFSLDYHGMWYYGPHEIVEEEINNQTVKGIIL